jgi:hypothetical protein
VFVVLVEHLLMSSRGRVSSFAFNVYPVPLLHGKEPTLFAHVYKQGPLPPLADTR